VTDRAVALVIGAGPAGLMAADRLLTAGHRVILADAMPSVGRKFLMAGKSGLNLTKAEGMDRFLAAFGGAEWLHPMLQSFGPEAVQAWARGLGQPVFTGSSGRVFPEAMKASPLLRAWLQRLTGLELRTRWRWMGIEGPDHLFQTPNGPARICAEAVVLALGGASWSRLGSDGAWAPILAAHGVPIASFQPANMGFHVDWSPHMAPHFGQPVKPLALMAGGQRVRGEVVISARGLEGGGLYPLSAALRGGAALTLDLLPDISPDAALARLALRPARETAAQALRKGLGLDGARLALALEFGRPWPPDAAGRVAWAKALAVPLGPPRPMDEAISTAGGIRAEGLTPDLMLHALPGVFAAGEMLDWEAPTGGYLLTGCLATGRWAGDAAARWLAQGRPQDDTRSAVRITPSAREN
jgi:uncharacterized flavoprotein (TIGR03862 family)